ncbi:MAG TPA: hypothetical protein VFI67_10780 [Sphingomicrobium sp.]|nr:hypothetical protein [Sphingomicrobium sp.]
MPDTATTTAEIVEARGDRMPFKVVFSKDGKVIAEHSVASYEGGRRLIATLLPLLQKHEDV